MNAVAVGILDDGRGVNVAVLRQTGLPCLQGTQAKHKQHGDVLYLTSVVSNFTLRSLATVFFH